jgi:hypothetical protein
MSKQRPNFCAASVKANKKWVQLLLEVARRRSRKSWVRTGVATSVVSQPLPSGQGVAKMMSRNLLLLQSIQGHLELLAQKHPKKAASPVARKAKQYVQSCLRQAHRPIAA